MKSLAAQIRHSQALSVIRAAASCSGHEAAAVAVMPDAFGSLRGGGELLRDGRHEPAGRVGVLAQLAQDRRELRRVDVVGALGMFAAIAGSRPLLRKATAAPAQTAD
ncbi:hypothetical protein [Streptomyces sp. NBC_00425]|uniref:hypothetical protein n=1 Tax=Streptomyces sp. NBC_00425 TaxID=2975740 RepID=UPI002E1F12EC